jgi:MOSC domain-containing protein YiiM
LRRAGYRCGMIGSVHQVSVSPRGGVPKLGVPSARVTRDGVEGDWQQDRKHHGGPQRAVCLFSLEVIRRLRGEGHPIGPGTAGENVTIEGLEWARMTPGARVTIGGEDGVELEIVSYTEPCSTIRESFAGLDSKRIKQELHPGESRVYARVLKEGVVREGDGVHLVEK